MLRKVNDYVGDKLAFGLSTMAAFWIVSASVILPLFFQTPHDLVGWVQYLIQSFFQGAALPVLGYVSRIAGERQEKMLNETHDCVMQELDLVKEELALAREERDEIKQLMAERKRKEKE